MLSVVIDYLMIQRKIRLLQGTRSTSIFTDKENFIHLTGPFFINFFVSFYLRIFNIKISWIIRNERFV